MASPVATRRGAWQKIPKALRTQLRERHDKPRKPSEGIVDSQSVKVANQGRVRGYDVGKKVSGRKRHLLVDTLGLVLLV
jgi:hypothetical protein